eukprot:RCo047114
MSSSGGSGMAGATNTPAVDRRRRKLRTPQKATPSPVEHGPATSPAADTTPPSSRSSPSPSTTSGVSGGLLTLDALLASALSGVSFSPSLSLPVPGASTGAGPPTGSSLPPPPSVVPGPRPTTAPTFSSVVSSGTATATAASSTKLTAEESESPQPSSNGGIGPESSAEGAEIPRTDFSFTLDKGSGFPSVRRKYKVRRPIVVVNPSEEGSPLQPPPSETQPKTGPTSPPATATSSSGTAETAPVYPSTAPTPAAAPPAAPGNAPAPRTYSAPRPSTVPSYSSSFLFHSLSFAAGCAAPTPASDPAAGPSKPESASRSVSGSGSSGEESSRAEPTPIPVSRGNTSCLGSAGGSGRRESRDGNSARMVSPPAPPVPQSCQQTPAPAPAPASVQSSGAATQPQESSDSAGATTDATSSPSAPETSEAAAAAAAANRRRRVRLIRRTTTSDDAVPLAEPDSSPATSAPPTTSSFSAGAPPTGEKPNSWKVEMEDIQRAEKQKELGNAAYRDEQWEAAVMHYSASISACPLNPSYYGNRAAAYWMLRKYQECLRDSMEAVGLDPSYYKGFARAGKACLQMGQLQEARRHLALALKLNPAIPLTADFATLNAAEVLQQKFEAQISANDASSALSKAKALTKLLPHALPVRLMVVQALTLLKPTEAVTEAQRVQRSFPASAEIALALARAHFFENSIPEALRVLRLAQQQQPSSGSSGGTENSELATFHRQVKVFEAEKTAANTAFQNGQWNDAYQKYTRLLSSACLQHNRVVLAIVHCNRAAAAKEMGVYTEAIADCTKAIEYNPKYARAWVRRARLHALQQDLDGAIRDFQRALGLEYSAETEQELRAVQSSRNKARTQQQQQSQQPFSDPPPQYRHSSSGSGGGGGSSHHQHQSSSASRSTTAGGGDTHYTVLGVARTASLAELKKAYRSLALQYHPDKWQAGTDAEKATAERKIKVINEAYAVLSDDRRRREYDASLRPLAGPDASFKDAYFRYFFSSTSRGPTGSGSGSRQKWGR